MPFGGARPRPSSYLSTDLALTLTFRVVAKEHETESVVVDLGRRIESIWQDFGQAVKARQMVTNRTKALANPKSQESLEVGSVAL